MDINTKGRVATFAALGTIGLVAAMIWWANREVQQATQQRRQMGEISRALTESRLVTFEYILHRHDRALEQEQGAARRIDALLASSEMSSGEGAQLLSDLRELNAASHRLFAELLGSPSAEGDGGLDSMARRFESQLASRLLLLQQEQAADAFRLSDLATERIAVAQQREVAVIAAGLLLMALTTVGASWLIRRDVLRPLERLEHGTRELANGNWDFRLDIESRDELGQMARHFDAMTRALRDSFDQVERNNLELAALNREIEAFSYSVSHDLRGPLRGMDGFSLALIEDYGDQLDDTARDYLQRIRAASQRMGRLIDELLALSRVTRAELNVGAVDFSGLAGEIAEGLAHQRREHPVQCEIEPGIIVHADRALLQIAMQNLMENAWKFTGKTEQPVVRIGAQVRDGEQVCYVADNGAGFDMAYAKRLFGAFQRLHHESEFPGTGIGLATVQRIIRRHGGRVWAEAKLGEGATFFFTLKELPDGRAEQGHPAG